MSSSSPSTTLPKVPAYEAYQACGKYRLIAKLGHGGMAEVFLAVASGIGGFTKLTVVKRIHPQLMEEPEFLDMFMDEARLAARLNHQNVVQTYEVDQSEDGLPYIAMEYLEGQSFDKVIRQASKAEVKVPRSISLRVVTDALAALDYAHNLADFDGSPLRVVHRDVSPSNLFVTYEGQVKLLDFGIAKATTQIAETRTGRVKGKFSYMAPEQARGQKLDSGADLWSMGVVLWEALAGKRLFKSDSDVKTIQMVIAGQIPNLRSIDASVPQGLLDIAECALTIDRKGRFESAAEMKAAIESVVAANPSETIATNVALPAFMRQLFKEVIAKHKERIQRSLELFKEHIESGGAPAAGARISLPTLGTGRHSSPSADGDTLAESSHTTMRRQTRMLRVGAVLAGILLVVVGALAAIVVTKGNDERDGAGDVDAEPVALAPTTAGAAEPSTMQESVPDPVPPSEVAMTEGALAEEEEGSEVAEVAEAEEPPQKRRTPSTAARQRWEALQRRRAEQAAEMAATTMDVEDPTMESASDETGRLSLVTTPWSEVYLGSRRLGTTPLIGVSLPVGTHVLTLRNPEEGISTRYTVRITVGEHTRARIGLR